MGFVQSSFEGGMYLFVLVWAPLLTSSKVTSGGVAPAEFPYGKAFACFMAACMTGSSILSPLTNHATKISVESKGRISKEGILARYVGISMAMGSFALLMVAFLGKDAGVIILTLCFVTFEGVVGLYFPACGQLGASFIPSANRSVITNLFRIPLNAIVIFGSLSMDKLGHTGVLSCSAISISVASVCLLILSKLPFKKKTEKTKNA